ncbi:hypothetical protein JCM11491_003070 [Sporobolomyces phaffii]
MSNTPAPSGRSTRKRDTPHTEDDLALDLDLDLDSPAPKKRAPRSTASEKAAKKSARMERNRIAAQASRDRKKNHTDYLEARIADLEAQLEQSNNFSSTPSSSSSSFALSLPPLVPSPPTHRVDLVPILDPEIAKLREENESLRTRLELEKLESKSLQLRLTSLEGKFGRLEGLLDKLSSSTITESCPAAADVPAIFSPQPCIPQPLDSSLSSFPDFAPTEFASDPLFDPSPPFSSLSFDAPFVDNSDISQAWSDWSLTVPDLDQPSQAQAEPATANFDLFEFLQQEVAQSHQGSAVAC